MPNYFIRAFILIFSVSWREKLQVGSDKSMGLWQVGSKRALFYPKEAVTARDEFASFLDGLKIF